MTVAFRRWEQDGETLVDWTPVAPKVDRRRLPRTPENRARMVRALRGRTSNPDFLPSLRLLVVRERYSLTDIGMMFGVSRERVRQWCVKYRIEPSDKWHNGLRAVRIWDDTLNRFMPHSRADVSAVQRQREVAERRAAVAGRRARRRARIATILIALKASLGRDPTQYEMATAVIGRVITASAGPLLVGRWGAPYLWRGTPEERRARYANALSEIEAATGIAVRSAGGSGHVVAPSLNPNILLKQKGLGLSRKAS